MQTVTDTYRSDYRVKGSKFLGYIGPANDRNDTEDFLEEIKNEHPNATHHCYAWRLNPNETEEFEQDDGEPKGTAGMPILNAMKSAYLINCIIVSVRYYGGTKLGKLGLIEAYGTSAGRTIEQSKLKKIIPVNLYRIVYEYNHQGIIDKFKNDFTLIEFNSEYLENVSLTVGVPLVEDNHFRGLLDGHRHLFDEAKDLGSSYHIVK